MKATKQPPDRLKTKLVRWLKENQALAISVGSLVLLSAGLFVGVRGCDADRVVYTEHDPGEGTLSAIASAYRLASEKNQRPPQSVAELRPHLREFGDPDKLLVSPNDKEQYVIVWGVNVNDASVPVLAYERKGAEGKRYVVNAAGVVTPMTAEEFAKLRFPPSHKPAP